MGLHSPHLSSPASPIPAPLRRILLVGGILGEQPQLHRARLDEIVQLPLGRLQIPQLLLQQSLLAGGPHGHLAAPGIHRAVTPSTNIPVLPSPPDLRAGTGHQHCSELCPPSSTLHPTPVAPVFPPILGTYSHWMLFLDFLVMSWMPSRTLVMS